MSTAKQVTDRFLEYLAEQGQRDALPEIAELLMAEALRRQEIHVISAAPLEHKEEAELKKTLLERWGEHPVVLTVDPILLSGMIIRFQDTIIDLSGKGRLTDLATHLK